MKTIIKGGIIFSNYSKFNNQNYNLRVYRNIANGLLRLIKMDALEQADAHGKQLGSS